MRNNQPVTQHEYDFPDDATLMSTTDANSYITYANAAFIQVSGYSGEEIEGQPHNLVRHPDMPKEAFADMWATLKSGEPWTALVKNRRKNGDHYWVRANAVPVMRNGQPTGYMSVRTKASRDEIAAAGVQIEVVTARGRVEVAREKLNAVMGEARNDRLAVLGDLETVPPVEPLSALTAQLDDAPLARVARAEMLRSNAAISLERARRIPDVTVSAGVKRVTTGGVPNNQAVVGVSIPIPLFNTNKGALLEATHKAERANADLDRERTRLRLELTQAYANFEAAEQEAQRLKSDILPAARLALDAMSRGYELGKFSFLDVLDAQRTLFQGQSQYVRALAGAHAARADIGRLVGTPLAAVAQ